MIFKKTTLASGEAEHYRLEQLSDDGLTSLCHADLFIRDTRLGGNYVRSMLYGGVGTPPEYRRRGYVRELFEKTLSDAAGYGAAVSLLHPFSFSYYRRMGYERIMDRLQVTFPLSALDFVPRFPDLVPYSPALLPGLLTFFEGFSKKRNCMFRRFDDDLFNPEIPHFFRGTVAPLKTYVLTQGAQVLGYVIYETRMHFDGINRVVSDGLYVHEIAFQDREALLKLLGFLRMYDGELDSVTFHDINPVPEVDLTLRHYMHASYRLIPTMAGRILDTKALLEKAAYGEAPGAFTLLVEDPLPAVAGRFRVEYKNGRGHTERLSAEGPWDVRCTATALTPFLYGARDSSPDKLAYCEGITLQGEGADFCRAFPRQTCGAFEFF